MSAPGKGYGFVGLVWWLFVLAAGVPPLEAQPPAGADASPDGSGSGPTGTEADAADVGREAPRRDGRDLQQEARQLFLEGSAAYVEGDFETALQLFRKAYEKADVQARVVLLVNIAQTLDRLGREQEALEHYRRYLQLMPDGPKAGVARGRIEVIERRIAQREAERERARERERALLAEAAEREAKARQEGRAAVWPWLVVGGAVLAAGGVVAAVLLTGGGEEQGLPVGLPSVDFRVEAVRGR